MLIHSQIGAAADTGIVESPLWSYSAGLDGGGMPTDPRTAVGTCLSVNSTQSPFTESYFSWQTGGAGAGRPKSVVCFPPVSFLGFPFAAGPG